VSSTDEVNALRKSRMFTDEQGFVLNGWGQRGGYFLEEMVEETPGDEKGTKQPP